jgi:hypothetical protein
LDCAVPLGSVVELVDPAVEVILWLRLRRAGSVRGLPRRRDGSTAVGHRMPGGNRSNLSYTWLRIRFAAIGQGNKPRRAFCTSNRFTISGSRSSADRSRFAMPRLDDPSACADRSVGD